MKRIIIYILFTLLFSTLYAQDDVFRENDTSIMPYGNQFVSWEVKTEPINIFHVNKNHLKASDHNPGTEDLPFQTIGKAAEVLQPGEMVIIHEGVYHEAIRPARGGTSPDSMIVYRAATGEKVIVKGSVEMADNSFSPSRGWATGGDEWYRENVPGQGQGKVWQCKLDALNFEGYNPFGMLNLMQDQEWLDYTKVNMDPHFKKRGLVFVDGIPLKQVRRPIELNDNKDGAYWPEHNGLTVHVRFPDGKSPHNSKVEMTTKEQLFAPDRYGLGYIKIEGIHFLHSGNGFPVPQRGMVSASRGHHWVIENCTIEWANSLGIDLGNEMWHTTYLPEVGFHVFRKNVVKNCGLSGLQGLRGLNYLIEDNLFENIGWHDAEHGFEAGAIKLHRSQNTLIRRNVFRDIVHAPGIWLDYIASKNCRVTNNVFTGITSARGCVYIEVSHERCRVDHNIFHNTKSQYWISGDYGAGGSALYTDGSDSIQFDHNLIYDIENTGYGSYANADRIVKGRGGTERAQNVIHNIFVKCGKHAIEFPNRHNNANNNVFSSMPAGYLKLKNPEPSLLLDLKAWQDYYQWGKQSLLIPGIQVDVDPQELLISISSSEELPVNVGPFVKYDDIKKSSIDPRH
ncbi:MAG: right-handed parallel beta-helix repeat-containing protein [Prolixibacteraceae bacterium]|nr:right-handed parallel beta-helix repeat-containing protein [Prolixibacteraceae bacterium]